MRTDVLRPIIALVLAMAFILLASGPAEAAGPVYNSGMRVIPANQYFIVKDFVALEVAGISYDVQVMFLNGPNVDVLLMDRQNFERYKSGDYFVYHSASSLNVNSVYQDTGIGGSLANGVEYLLVIDNTNRPPRGAPGDAEVRVMFTFGGGNIQTVNDWGMILIILAAVAAVVVVTVLVLIALLQKSKGKGPMDGRPYGQQNQGGMKPCPRCGAQVPAEFPYCPRCGNRW